MGRVIPAKVPSMDKMSLYKINIRLEYLKSYSSMQFIFIKWEYLSL